MHIKLRVFFTKTMSIIRHDQNGFKATSHAWFFTDPWFFPDISGNYSIYLTQVKIKVSHGLVINVSSSSRRNFIRKKSKCSRLSDGAPQLPQRNFYFKNFVTANFYGQTTNVIDSVRPAKQTRWRKSAGR